MRVNFKVGEKAVLVDDISGHHGLVGMRAGDVVTVLETFTDVSEPYMRIATAAGEEVLLFMCRFRKYDPARDAGIGCRPAGSTSRKDDSGKLDMTLLDDMPNAIKAVVEVMQWAVKDKKPVPYERGSWQGVHADRYRAAIMRHNQDACYQSVSSAPIERNRTPARFEKDAETNLLHLAHIACSALMALENTIREMKEKN